MALDQNGDGTDGERDEGGMTGFPLTAILPLATAATGGDTHGEAAHTGAPELPNIVSLIWGHDSAMGHWMNVVFAAGIGILLSF